MSKVGNAPKTEFVSQSREHLAARQLRGPAGLGSKLMIFMAKVKEAKSTTTPLAAGNGRFIPRHIGSPGLPGTKSFKLFRVRKLGPSTILKSEDTIYDHMEKTLMQITPARSGTSTECNEKFIEA